MESLSSYTNFDLKSKIFSMKKLSKKSIYFIFLLAIVILLVHFFILFPNLNYQLAQEINNKCSSYTENDIRNWNNGDFDKDIYDGSSLSGIWETLPSRGCYDRLIISEKSPQIILIEIQTHTCFSHYKYSCIGMIDNNTVFLEKPAALAFGKAFKRIFLLKNNEELVLLPEHRDLGKWNSFRKKF